MSTNTSYLKVEEQRSSYIPTESDIPPNLLKEFKTQVSQSDFVRLKDEPNKNLGFFDEVFSLLYKNNKTLYYVKAIDKKKSIINNSYLSILNNIYKLNDHNQKSRGVNIYDYIINLQTHWEDNDRLFLVFNGIKRYTLFENLIKNHSEDITEENIIAIFRQILEVVNFLHENNLFGCNLYLSSFIFDKLSQSIKFTDLGFSKIFKTSKNLNDNILSNGFEFNEYAPPEYIGKDYDPSFFAFEIDKIKNPYFDIWQLGILFYKIATFGASPYDDAKNEVLKEYIMNKNINYSRLNKYSPQISQIIDKMLQTSPSNRYSIKQLLNLEPFKIVTKIPLININFKNEDKSITMKMVNSQKGKVKDAKVDMASILDNLDAKKKTSKEITFKDGKSILDQIKIQGSFVNDKNSIISQEIYPDGSVLPIFKNKFLNKFNNIDKNLVLDLSSKLTLLEKEYKKLDENKLAVYNITNYVNSNLKELNKTDNDNINLLIKKFNNLQLSKIETNDLYEEMLRNKGEFAQDKFKALISNLIYEIKRLNIELEQEKSTSEKLRKKIKDQEKRNMDLKLEHQEKVEFYEKKIELLEEVIFNDDKNLNNNKNSKKNELIYKALNNSMKDFTEVNIQLKTSLEENLAKFRENKKFWLQDMIKAKENFRNEMSFYLSKSLEQPKIYNFEKKENKGISNKNEKNEKIEELNKQVSELYDLINEQKLTVDSNINIIKELKRDIKTKDDKIEELTRKLNDK